MTPSASIVSELWNDQLVAHDRQGLFLVLVGFLASFGFIRLSARLMRSPRTPWWPGSVVSESGLHLHHLVWGICLMLGAGTLGFLFFAASPWLEVCAVLFGIGAGLTIDEFALWVYLDDVYWAEQGRVSIDATVFATTTMLLVLLGARPFDVATGTVLDAVASFVSAAIVLAVVTICFAKQRLLHGTLGFFVSPIAMYGAMRIGKPGSPWAKRFYGARNAAKQAKARRRFTAARRTERLKERFRDAVGGETSEAYARKLAERTATHEAAAQVHARAERAAADDRRQVIARIRERSPVGGEPAADLIARERDERECP